MNPEHLDPLAGLRAYQMPEALHWWPPAPGWWLLCLLALLVTLGLVIRRRRRRRGRSLERLALRELAELKASWAERGDVLTVSRDLASLLRRYAYARYPGDDAAGLCGDAWIRYLGRRCEQAPAAVRASLGGDLGRSLVDLPYRPLHASPDDEPDVEVLAHAAEALIRAGGRAAKTRTGGPGSS